MKPLFTIHAGEFLVGDYIQRHFTNVNTWIPAKDSGVDLLVTDKRNQRTVSLQVKFSRDYAATHDPELLRGELRASGWWKLTRRQLASSSADYWIFVLVGFAHRTVDYMIVDPSQLVTRFGAIHGQCEIFQSYLCVTRTNRCWERRGLRRADLVSLAGGTYINQERDFTPYLNNWQPIQSLDN